MRKLFTVIMISSIVLVSCGGSNEVEIGNKTTMIVDPVYDAGTVIQGEVITAKIKESLTTIIKRLSPIEKQIIQSLINLKKDCSRNELKLSLKIDNSVLLFI